MRAVDVDVHCRKAVGETLGDETLRSKVITLIKVVLANDVVNAGITLERGRVKNQPIEDVGKTTKTSVGGFERNSANEAVDFVAQVQKVLCKITAVLPCDAGNKRLLRHSSAFPSEIERCERQLNTTMQRTKYLCLR